MPSRSHCKHSCHRDRCHKNYYHRDSRDPLKCKKTCDKCHIIQIGLDNYSNISLVNSGLLDTGFLDSGLDYTSLGIGYPNTSWNSPVCQNYKCVCETMCRCK